MGYYKDGVWVREAYENEKDNYPVKSDGGKKTDSSYVDKGKTYGVSSATGNTSSLNSQLASLQSSANNASQNGIVSQNTWDAINKTFQASENTIAAMQKTNELLQKVTEGRTSYTDKMNEIMASIEGRDKFSYDPNTDTLFKNALSSAMGKGQTAMKDTMGQAAALTGGYGSSYSQAVGNQAYNQEIEKAYDNLPEYYQMSLNQYNQETQDMYNLYGMYQGADATEYGRYVDSYNANASNWQTLYNQEFNEWQAANQNAYNAAQLQMSESNSIYDRQQSAFNSTLNYDSELWDRKYKNASLSQSQANADREFEYQKYKDSYDRLTSYNQYMDEKNLSLEKEKTAQMEASAKEAAAVAESSGSKVKTSHLTNALKTQDSTLSDEENDKALNMYIDSLVKGGEITEDDVAMIIDYVMEWK